MQLQFWQSNSVFANLKMKGATNKQSKLDSVLQCPHIVILRKVHNINQEVVAIHIHMLFSHGSCIFLQLTNVAHHIQQELQLNASLHNNSQ